MEYDQSNMFSEIIVKEWWDDDGDDHYDDGAVGKRPVGWSPSHRLPPGFPLPWELVHSEKKQKKQEKKSKTFVLNLFTYLWYAL